MILSDGDIRSAVEQEMISIDPFEPDNVQPASVDLRLDNTFRMFSHSYEYIDPVGYQPFLSHAVRIPSDEILTIRPGGFMLGSTVERVTIPPDFVARIEGKSSLGRVGLMVHSTAGFVDPGFEGNLTLELANVNSLPIALRPGMLIAQISFYELSSVAERPYGHPGLGSKYQGQTGPTAARTKPIRKET